MAKKAIEVEETAVVAEGAAEGAAPVKPLPTASSARYILGQWNGMPMWRCPVCQFDTLDGEGVIQEHMRAHQPGPVAAPAAPEPRFDRFGNPW